MPNFKIGDIVRYIHSTPKYYFDLQGVMKREVIEKRRLLRITSAPVHGDYIRATYIDATPYDYTSCGREGWQFAIEDLRSVNKDENDLTYT